MCDYSLHHFPSRLCAEEENLVTYRFSSGCIGLIAAADGPKYDRSDLSWLRRDWPALRSWLLPRVLQPGPTAVCVAHGTRLLVGCIENATFVQTNLNDFQYRDGLRFKDGRVILLQALPPGTRLRISPALGQTEGAEPNLESVACESA